MEKLTLKQLLLETLKKADKPLTIKEIFEQINKYMLSHNLTGQTLRGKQPKQVIGSHIYTDINKTDSSFIQTSKRPATFWLRERENELTPTKQEIIQTEQETVEAKKEKEANYKERDLHPLLVKYLFEVLALRSKTIYHEKSAKAQKGLDKWIHPDIVAIHFPFENYQKTPYDEETLKLLKNLNLRHCKIYSFELKIRLKPDNIKEAYFQAVSNSSFANEGYLVVYEKIDGETFKELRRLHATFGIGVIQLQADILKSEILLQARENPLDIQTIDLLIEKNEDFRAFIQNVNARISQTVIKRDHFDKIFSKDEMREYLANKHLDKYIDE